MGRKIEAGQRVRSFKVAELIGTVTVVRSVLDRKDPSWSDPQVVVRYDDGRRGQCRASQLVEID